MDKITRQFGVFVAVVVVFSLLAGFGYATQVGVAQMFDAQDEPAKPISENESVWEDVPEEDLDYEPRLDDRPGNLEVVTKTGEFWEGMYKVEPDYEDVAYPLNWNGRVYKTKAENDAKIREQESEARESGRKLTNKLRRYNVVIHRLTFVNLEPGMTKVPNADELGFDQHDRLSQVRKSHDGRAVLVLHRAGFESLESDKIEGDHSDSDFVLLWAKKADGWKLVWFEK